MSLFARISGKVTRVTEREYSKKDATGKPTGELGTLTFARVLVGDEGASEVLFPNGFPTASLPDRGQQVDWLVEITASGGRIRCGYLEKFPLDTLESRDALDSEYADL